MWTKPALARAIRQQSIAHRRRSYTFTPAPLPRDVERAAQEAMRQNEPTSLPRQTISSEVVLSD
ncbi:MAG TPA: hypothetical protein VFS62_10270 [Chloroflexota bacterium]|jgi:hypothetical protein|nr:hypothetical protein [Chloroflexota bacterium]